MAEELLDRLQRNAVLWCAVIAVLAMALTRDWRAGMAVAGGGVLIGTSFLSIRGGVGDLSARRSAGRAVLKIAGRYALLGFLAYVMIARLRLPPLGLIAGASSVVAAVMVESVRVLLTKTKTKTKTKKT